VRNVRKPPLDAVMALHLPQKRGKCRWCGKPTVERTGHTKALRWWHADCEAIVHAISRAEIMRDLVFARDKGICAVCGEDWSEHFRLVPEYVPKWRSGAEQDEHATRGPDGKRFVVQHWTAEYQGTPPTLAGLVGRYPWVSLIAISLWHVEHVVPLWKVEHLPAVDRIRYFMLSNLQTVCEPCHKHKSRKETAERHHYVRMGEKPVVMTSRWPKGRKLRSGPMRRKK
jgi:hypothetical protein